VAWYDVSDLSTLFTTSTGTTQVAANDDPVGFVGDKSQGFVLGAELVTNGDFSNGTTGWVGRSSASISVVDGALLIDDPTGSGFAEQVLTTVANTWYKITGEFVSATAVANATVWAGATSLGNNFLSQTLGNGFTGSFSFYFYATTTTTYLNIGYGSSISDQTVSIDNISTKPIPGNHLTQSTATARPLYKTDGTRHWLEFDGADDLLRFDAGSGNEIAQPINHAIAFQFRELKSQNAFNGVDADVSDFVQYLTMSTSIFVNNAGADAALAARDTEKHVHSVEFNGAGSKGYLDGALESSANMGTNAWRGSTVAANRISTAFGAVDVYQYVILSGLLSDGDRAKLDAFLAGKIGVTL
jgi:hypothetical protein